MKKNNMREIKIEKVVLSVGGMGEELEKGVLLLKKIVDGRKPAKMKTKKRIPSWNVRAGAEVGAVLTVRKNIKELLNKLFDAIGRKLKKKQISENHFSFGIEEYIEIPGMEYDREIGIRGFDVTVVFTRAGKRVKKKKYKRGKIPSRQKIGKEEIIDFLKENFNVEVIGK